MATKDLLIAIDIGTQSGRAALIDFHGNIWASSGKEYDLHTPAPGWAEQDAHFFWNATTYNIRKILQTSGVSADRVAAVAAAAQMHGPIPIDRDGNVLVPQIQLWLDKRNAELVQAMSLDPEISNAYDHVGNTPSTAWLGFKIKWIQENQPDVYAKTWKFLTISAYITYMLTRVPVIDPSEASGSYLMDAKRETWSAKMFEVMGLDLDKFPEILGCSQIAGCVTEEAARQTGLTVGTPVAVGSSDMMASLLTAGLTEIGFAVDITGTAAMLCILGDKPVSSPCIQNLHHAMPGWITFGIVEYGGVSLKWFKDEFCLPEIQEAKQQGVSPYWFLNKMAAAVPSGSEGLLFYPYFLGERGLGSPYSRGVFFGLTPRVGRGVMARAIMEGIVFDMRRALEIAEDGGLKVTQIRSVGGGAQSPLWCQIRADIYKKPIAMVETFEGGTLGSAMLAGVAAGVYEDVSEAANRLVKVARIIEPDSKASSIYDQQFEIFKDLHDRMMEPWQAMAKITSSSGS